MATLALASDFLSDFAKLDHAVRARVHDLAEKCRSRTMAELTKAKGLHLEPYQGQKDPRARTIRLGDNHRGIVLVPEGSDRIVLVNVLPHQDADRWMLRNEFKVNAATGALEIIDSGAIAEQVAAVEEHAASVAPPPTLLFDHRSDKDFTQLGVDESLLPVLRVLQNETQLEALLLTLPQGQAEALILLTGDESVETIYAQIAGTTDPGEIDPDDLAAAIDAPASKSRFHVVTGEADLAEMLARPLAQWRTYLHPSQETIAYKPTYNGPVRVTGGAGTGKTVVAMHRALALAEQFGPSPTKPILFTTFTRNLAQSIERDLAVLGGTPLLDAVDVINVDRFATQVVKAAEGQAPSITASTSDRLKKLWETRVDELGVDVSPVFAFQEWEQIVLAQGIDSRYEYFRATRSGRGVRLDRRQRAQVWKVIEAATQEMDARELRTYVQIAARAAGYLQTETVKPYRHVIVDEAQDLHESQWRLLRAAVDPAPNDLFIVGDAHQRIYGRRSSLSRLDINIRGRSHKLRINYRTTRQILRWALAVLGAATFDDLDEGTDSQDLAGYHSFLEGSDPVCEGFTSQAAMIDGLVAQVRSWIADGLDPEDIAVSARVKTSFSSVRSALRTAGIPAYELGPELKPAEGVAIGTMHRLKGLEFRAVGIVGVSADQLPNPYFLTSATDDQVQHDVEVQQERSLLYVAATRARDALWVGWSGEPSPFLEPVLRLE